MREKLILAALAVAGCLGLHAPDAWSLDWKYTDVASTPSVNGNLEAGTQIEIAPDGSVHAMYRWNEQGQYEYRYVTFDGTSWTQRKVFSSGRSLAVDSLSHPHFAYASAGTIRHAWWDGTAWQDELVFDAPSVIPSGSAGSVDLFIDPADGLHFAYRVSGYDCDISQNFNAIYYTTHDGAGWDTESTVRRNGSTSGLGGPILAVDGSGVPHINFAAEGQIKQTRPAGSNWPESVVFTGSFDYRDMAVDSDGIVHVAWQDQGSGKFDLAYAVWNGYGWDVKTVESYEDVGAHLSLALDPLGQPCISYWNRTDKDLKFVCKEGDTWVREIVRGAGYNGSYTSLDIDDVGNIHILYFRADGPIEYIAHAYHEIPEPATILLLGTALLSVPGITRRRGIRE